MAKVHYNVKQEVNIDCEYIVDYCTYKGDRRMKSVSFETTVEVGKEFEYAWEDPQVLAEVEGNIEVYVLRIPKTSKVYGMIMTRFVVVSYDLVVLSEVTPKQPAPTPLMFHVVEEGFSIELQTEMEKPWGVCLCPMLESIVDLGVEIREFMGWSFRAAISVKVGENVVHTDLGVGIVCAMEVYKMVKLFELIKVVDIRITVWKPRL